MILTETQDAINRRVYHARGVHRKYMDVTLDPAEVTAIIARRPSFHCGEVLEMGVGTGRATRHLARFARRYVGIDYSPTMVAHARRALPDADVRLIDMRDLGAFGDESFDCVFALCNLLDAVSHADRQTVLRETHRVLRGGGTFIFSSHNRRYHRAGEQPKLELARDPLTQVRNLAKYVLRVLNHRKVRCHRRWEDDYAVLNDPGHHYALLHYYVSRPVQERQLEEWGFTLLEAFARDGRRLRADDDDSDTSDILYVARRDGPPGFAGPGRAGP
jgi:SAM-dependent methyltransferase